MVPEQIALACVYLKKLRFTNHSSFAVPTHIWKTLEGGQVNEFVGLRIDDIILCVVLAYQLFVEDSKSIAIDLSKGYLISTLDVSKSVVTKDHVSSSSMFSGLSY